MKKTIWLLSIGILYSILPVHSQEITFRPYLGCTTDYILLIGSFDGKSFFETDYETILVPKLEPSIGFGFQFGIKIGKGAVDLAYHITRMDYSTLLNGFSGKSTTHLIRYLSFKKYFSSFAESKIEPYFDFDLSVALSHFEKVSYLLNNQSEFRSANYGGVVFGTGVGSQINLTKNLAIDIKVLPELYIGTDIRSKNSKRYEIKKFNNFLMIASFGLNYYFKAK